MISTDRWLLPDGIDELLPPQAQQLEMLRRKLLDLYHSWGYELIIPPHIEYLEAMQTASTHDLDRMTFKLTDPLTGRMMGLRADTTPAAARIDAHTLKQSGLTRLCYVGSTFHTQPANLGASRCPIQVGAELYGHQGAGSDGEILCLLMETLKVASVAPITLDIGHIRIYKELINYAQLTETLQQNLFDHLQKKAIAPYQALIQQQVLDPTLQRMLLVLPQLNGDITVLEQAQQHLQGAPDAVIQALEEVRIMVTLLTSRYPEHSVHVDLAELSGYDYHTGITLSAYTSNSGQAIARGGRYDGIGHAFGRARPATGFSCDLKALLPYQPALDTNQGAILAPDNADFSVVSKLRTQGHRVIYHFGDDNHYPAICDRLLHYQDGQWHIKTLSATQS